MGAATGWRRQRREDRGAAVPTTSVIGRPKLVIASIEAREIRWTPGTKTRVFLRKAHARRPQRRRRRAVRSLRQHCLRNDIATRNGGQFVRFLTRPGIGEAMASAICVVAVLATLVGIDSRVRDRFVALVNQASSDGLATWGERVGALGDAVVQAARDHSIEQAPLLVFTVVAAALLIFMLRT